MMMLTGACCPLNRPSSTPSASTPAVSRTAVITGRVTMIAIYSWSTRCGRPGTGRLGEEPTTEENDDRCQPLTGTECDGAHDYRRCATRGERGRRRGRPVVQADRCPESWHGRGLRLTRRSGG